MARMQKKAAQDSGTSAKKAAAPRAKAKAAPKKATPAVAAVKASKARTVKATPAEAPKARTSAKKAATPRAKAKAAPKKATPAVAAVKAPKARAVKATPAGASKAQASAKKVTTPKAKAPKAAPKKATPAVAAAKASKARTVKAAPAEAVKTAPKEAAGAGKSAKVSKKSARTINAGETDLFKGEFFFEVPVGSAAVRKVKTAIVQTTASTKKTVKAEETHEELLARVEQELQRGRFNIRKAPQKIMICTKCGLNPVDEAYIVDRDTAYCADCADMLGLGHSREARHQNFHPSLRAEESEEEEEG